jgi:hypothetical protein
MHAGRRAGGDIEASALPDPASYAASANANRFFARRGCATKRQSQRTARSSLAKALCSGTARLQNSKGGALEPRENHEDRLSREGSTKMT